MTGSTRTSSYGVALANASTEALVALSPAGEILWWSKAAAAVFGHGPDEVTGQTLEALLRADAEQTLAQAIEETMLTRSAVWTATVHRKGGEPIHLEAILRRVDPDPWIAFAGRDVSERVRMTREILHKTWQLEGTLAETTVQLVRRERLAAIGELAAGIGHDLRNPLAAIANALHYISKKLAPGQVDARVVQFIGLAQKELGNCEQTIAGLLDFARDRPLSATTTALGPLIADAVAVVAVPRHVEIEIDVPASLPPVEIDATQIRRVLANLVQNACEAIPATRTGTVRLTATGTADSVTVSVADDGDGIAPDVSARIFDPLFTTKARGTGLGLAVVARIVERHGGRVDVEPAPGGRGTVFSVWLPGRSGGAR